MNYLFKCNKCGKKQERDIPMSEYDKRKNNQVCECGGKMQRVIQWQGIAEGGGDGWCGKKGTKTI